MNISLSTWNVVPLSNDPFLYQDNMFSNFVGGTHLHVCERVRSSGQVGGQAEIDVVILHIGTHLQIVRTGIGIVVS